MKIKALYIDIKKKVMYEFNNNDILISSKSFEDLEIDDIVKASGGMIVEDASQLCNKKDLIYFSEQISKNLKRYTEGLTQYQLSDMTGIPVSTLSGYFAMRSTPNAGNVQKIADALHIKKSDIDPRFSDSLLNQETEITELTQRDEREIESDLEDMMNSVSSAAYEGDGDIEDMEAFKATIKAAMMVAKKIAKKKYTPKKYRKD